ncbi:GbsR/MarR family transcriptional regulator [Thermodesulfobacteriota bacterium]
MSKTEELSRVRMGLVETGARTSQDLGMGRIVGQILVYLYLQPHPCSLDELENELGLSKASVSIAARQLEQLGLVQRVWVRGDRKKYYRSAENIGQAMQQGLLSLVRQKVRDFGDQLDQTMQILDEIDDSSNDQVRFLQQRVKRAGKLQCRLDRVLGNPLVALLAKATGSLKD